MVSARILSLRVPLDVSGVFFSPHPTPQFLFLNDFAKSRAVSKMVARTVGEVCGSCHSINPLSALQVLYNVSEDSLDAQGFLSGAPARPKALSTLQLPTEASLRTVAVVGSVSRWTY